jgi:hypothetical protein
VARTTPADVQGLLQVGSGVVLTGFIDIASSVVTANCEGKADVNGDTYTDETLELIERALAAHLAYLSNFVNDGGPLTRERIGDAEEERNVKFGLNLDASQYGQMAKMLDSGGYLAALENSQRLVKKVLPAGYKPKVSAARWVSPPPPSSPFEDC